ncbi:hypothetical protein [uncultured Desulfobacter sp.]|uniref:hypothetical protein n=1 Tax=uncultured Desulfobacter sp. TaxID=240139 RepID=UPI002AABC46E|nr:hypothetical protein [uncultured Desulfobacter sp.]
MKNINNIIRIVIILFFVEGCATVKDIQRSTDLIRTDNELARIIHDERPVQGTEKGAELSILGDHAKTQADHLKEERATILDAIAYYRIASTAYWQSLEEDTVKKFFEAADAGKELCHKLDNDVPDRDCLFLQLVIPFAGLESENNTMRPQELLSKVDFNDGEASDEELAHMNTIYASLKRSKQLLDHILSVGNRVLGSYYSRTP